MSGGRNKGKEERKGKGRAERREDRVSRAFLVDHI